MKQLTTTVPKQGLHTIRKSSSFVCLFFFLSISSAHAGIIKIDSDFQTLRVGDVVSIDVIADTEMQTINAVEAVVVFPADILTFKKVDDSDSVVSFWVEKPTYDNQSRIHFSGITPGGFSDAHAMLLTLSFEVIKEGQGNIQAEHIEMLLHDGSGTKTTTTAQNLHLAVVGGLPTIQEKEYVDSELPEFFTPVITRDTDVFEGAWYLVFDTKDKSSGIANFKVKEGFFGVYHTAESPYKLRNQNLNKKIFVKATDNAGNKRIAVLYGEQWKVWYQNQNVLAIIVLSCVLILFLLKTYRKRYTTS